MASGQSRSSERIFVVGAGIVGVSCAFFLQRDGHAVTLLDPRPPGAGTSSGNAGIISLGSLLPIATPGIVRRAFRLLRDPVSPLAIRWSQLPRLLPWLVRFVLASRRSRLETTVQAIATLLDQADAAHDLVIQQCGLADLVHPVGWLKVAYERDTLLEATVLDRELWSRHGRRFDLLDAAEVHQLEPALSPDIKAGLLLPANRAVRHPQRYVEGIARTFLERGGEYLQAEAVDLASDEGRVERIYTDRGRIELGAGDGLVIAAGAFSKYLARRAGARVPLDAERGYHVMLPAPESSLSRPVYTIDHAFILAPMEHGIRLTGGVELASPEAPPDYRRVRRLVPIARRVLPGLSGEILSEWQGCRPSLPDSLPVIGKSPRRSNVWLAFGHQHVGLTLGPATGRIVADLVAGRDPGLDLTPYRPDRRFF